MINTAKELRESYSTEEATTILGLSIGSIREKCLCGEIKAKKVGKNWRISRQEINRLLGRENEDTLKQALYIQELENQLKMYKQKIDLLKELVGTLNGVVGENDTRR